PIFDDAAPDKMRPLFHLFKYFGDIISYDTDGKQVDRAKKENRQQHRGDSFWRRTRNQQGKQRLSCANQDRDKEQQRAKIAQDGERRIAKRKNTLFGPEDILYQILFGFSKATIPADIVHSNLFEPYKGAHPTQEQISLREFQDTLHHLLIHQ